MKIKCDDGLTRNFEPAHCDGDYVPPKKRALYGGMKRFQAFSDAMCLECGEEFGCHSTNVLKPTFRKHDCEIYLVFTSSPAEPDSAEDRT